MIDRKPKVWWRVKITYTVTRPVHWDYSGDEEGPGKEYRIDSSEKARTAEGAIRETRRGWRHKKKGWGRMVIESLSVEKAMKSKKGVNREER